MNKKIIVLLIVLFLIGVGLGGYWFGLNEKNEEFEDVVADNRNLSEKLNQSLDRVEVLEDLVSEKNTTIEGLSEKINRLNNTVKEQNQAIDNLDSEIKSLEEFLAIKNASLSEAREQIDSYEEILVTKNETINELQEEVSYLESVVDEKNETIISLKENNTKLRDSLVELNGSLEEARAEVRNLSDRVVELEELVSEGYVVDNSSFGVLAVYENTNEGIVLGLETEYEVGDGELNVDIINTTYGEKYIQSSFRTALDVSTYLSNVSLSNRSVDQEIFSPNTTLEVDGPSAGAAICLAQISVFKNKTINQSILITGTINRDGSIGRVGEVRAKVIAAREKGYELVLVPDGQSVSVSGIDVKEVSNIQEAGELLFKKGV
ncbi:hypothetical protein C9439_01160 [archaeon SCG-AAA382B04]|nr:hypothetical protein C9439_01160 [archaeon SCG-AAA382B04]